MEILDSSSNILKKNSCTSELDKLKDLSLITKTSNNKSPSKLSSQSSICDNSTSFNSTGYVICDRIAIILESIVEYTEEHDTTNPLSDEDIPNISISEYLIRILEFTEIEQPTLICAMIYLDNLCQVYQLNQYSLFRSLFGCILISVKFNEDTCYDNKDYGKVGGLSLEEANSVEFNILGALQYNLMIDLERYETYLQLMLSME